MKYIAVTEDPQLKFFKKADLTLERNNFKKTKTKTNTSTDLENIRETCHSSEIQCVFSVECKPETHIVWV